MKERVVITGLGVICAAGNNVRSFTNAISRGVSSLSPVEDYRLSHFGKRYAGMVMGFSPPEYRDNKEIVDCDRYAQFALHAAGEALADAALSSQQYGDSLGLIFATCSGPMQTIEKRYEQRLKKEPAYGEDDLFRRSYYSAARMVCHRFGISGLSTTITTACSSSAAAVGIATDLIRQGVLRAALVGGSDSFSPTTFAGFEGLKAISVARCAPFSKPLGMNLGEGSGFFVLERLEDALQRNAIIYAEVLGYGISNDAYHCTAPDGTGKGQSLAMFRALHDAASIPSDIAYINAHGTGTEANDKAETKAIVRVFRENAATVRVSSTKSMIGHCLGAAGAIELLATIVCFRQGVLPSTAQFSGPREGCTLDYIPLPGRAWTGAGMSMNNNFAFGGNNVSVILSHGAGEKNLSGDLTEDHSDPVVITACGVVSPAGIGIDALREAYKAKAPLGVLHHLQGKSVTCALVPAFDERVVSRKLDLKGMDNASRYAVIAAKIALQNAGIAEHRDSLRNVGFYLGLSSGATRAEAEHIVPLIADGFHVSQVQAFPYIVPNAIGGNVCRALGLQGHNTVFTAGLGSGIMALAGAVVAIRAGHCTSFLCGGVDELLESNLPDSVVSSGENDSLKGFSAEGAALFFLERASVARLRGKEPVAEICGMAFSTDCQGRNTRDTSTGLLEKTIRNAILQSAIEDGSIGAVCVVGNDFRLINAIKKTIILFSGDFVDVSGVTGIAPSCIQLLSCAEELFNGEFGKRGEAKYILLACSSPEGSNSALILKKGCAANHE